MGSCEEELKAIVRDLGVPNFLGTFDKRFPGFISPHRPACAIVNTAARETGGQHWLALAWYPKSKTFYLFEPFGFSDLKLRQIYDFEYQSLLKRSAISSTPDRCINLIRNTETVQGPESAACGLFCCMFLHSFSNWPDRALNETPTMALLKGVPNSQLKNQNYQSILRQNQENLYRFLASKSTYFRTHRPQIERNTAFDKLQTMKF